MTFKRTACALSATGLLAIAGYEGYSSVAYIPVEGDVPTIGFGSTKGVKIGDKVTVREALVRLARDVGDVESAIGRCVTVPLSQGEYDAYTSLAFHIGTNAFCNSTLVKLLNQGRYEDACYQLPRWVYFKGKIMDSFVRRRKREMEQCLKH